MADEKVLEALKQIGTKKFVFVGGKGGVGKSSTSCSLALALGRELNKRVLLISTDPAHSVSDCLEQSLSNDPQPITGSDSVWALESDPSGSVDAIFGSAEEAASQGMGDFMQQFKQMMSEMRDWLSSMPGVDEAIALMRLLDVGLETNYDIIVLDTAPTGHTLKLLQLPGVLESGIQRLEGWQVRLSQYLNMAAMFLSSNGPPRQPPAEVLAEKLKELKSGVEKLKSILTDPSKTEFICVGIAEALSVMESNRLLQSLRKANVHSEYMIVNKLLTQTFLPSEDDKEELEEDDREGSRKVAKLSEGDSVKASSKLSQLRDQALFLCQSRAKMQAKYLDQLIAAHRDSHTIIQVQELPFEPRGTSLLKNFFESWTI